MDPFSSPLYDSHGVILGFRPPKSSSYEPWRLSQLRFAASQGLRSASLGQSNPPASASFTSFYFYHGHGCAGRRGSRGSL